MCPQVSGHLRRSWPNTGSHPMIDPYIGISEKYNVLSVFGHQSPVHPFVST
jgi:hypothetical protein